MRDPANLVPSAQFSTASSATGHDGGNGFGRGGYIRNRFISTTATCSFVFFFLTIFLIALNGCSITER